MRSKRGGWLERGRKLLKSRQSHRVFGTLAADVFTGALIIWTYRLTSVELGQDALGEYQIVRAFVTICYPVLLLGSGVVVPRRIARAVPVNAASRPVLSLIDAAWLVGAGLGSLAVCLAAIIPATWWAGRADARPMLLLASILSLGVALCSTSMSSLTGLGRFVEFNLLKITFGGVVPVIAVITASRIEEMVRNLAALSALIALASIWWVRRSTNLYFVWKNVRGGVGEIARFGTPRIIGDFAFYSFLTVPTLVAGAQSGADVASVLGVGASLVTIGIGVISPMSVVILPWASNRLGDGDCDVVRTHARLIVGTSAGCAVLASSGLALFAPAMVALVKIDLDQAVGLLVILAAAIPPLAVFIALRSFIDAASLRALNAYNAVIGAGVIAAMLLSLDFSGVGDFRFPIASLTGALTLAVLSTLSAKRLGVL